MAYDGDMTSHEVNEARNDIALGSTVSYDGRAQGVKVGEVQKRETVAPYSGVGPEIVYYHVSTSDLLVPAADVLDIMAAKK